jgi:hypothetical protein
MSDDENTESIPYKFLDSERKDLRAVVNLYEIKFKQGILFAFHSQRTNSRRNRTSNSSNLALPGWTIRESSTDDPSVTPLIMVGGNKIQINPNKFSYFLLSWFTVTGRAIYIKHNNNFHQQYLKQHIAHRANIWSFRWYGTPLKGPMYRYLE